MAHTRFVILTLSFLLALCSCTEKRDKKILSADKMEKILYDYHLTQGVLNYVSDQERRTKTDEYMQAVLAENGVTTAEFDSSMVWYNRNTKELKKIYDNLQKRYESLNEEMKLKSGSNEITNVFSEGADTTNIWNGAKLIVLRNRDILNKYTFSFTADTSYYKNDLFVLSLNSNFLNENQDDRSCVLYASLSVTYANGKTISDTKRANRSGNTQLKVDAMNDSEIKSINGFMFYKGQESTRNYAAINGISLYRMHREKPEAPQETAPADSVSNDTVVEEKEEVTKHQTPEEIEEKSKKSDRINLKKSPERLTPNKFGPSRRRTTRQAVQR